ncbi:MAG: hypothetical protein ACRDRN_28475, partial [Sciscionella sp.]
MSPMRALIDLDRVGTLFLHKIARAVELIELGLSSHTIYHRCRPNGPWQRLLPGVILLSSAPPGRTERIQAALRYAGTGALVTGWDALALHGMKNTVCGGPVHLLVPLDKQVRSATTVQIERTKRLPRPTMRSGFPVTHLSRAALDTTRRIDDVDQARATLAEAVQRGTTPAALRAELGCGSNRGSALP